MKKIHPIDVILHRGSRSLEIQFNNGEHYDLPWEYLRVYSPSSEVRGRRGSDSILVTGKENVSISDIKPVGNYAVKL
ncbi:MAG: gamma-butyrobetaine hydroxylase-like domain-containing protein, partial [Arenicellales bacterium]